MRPHAGSTAMPAVTVRFGIAAFVGVATVVTIVLFMLSANTGVNAPTTAVDSMSHSDALKAAVRSEVARQINGINNGAAAIIPVPKLPTQHQKRILVTGGAGFVGSHLVDRLMGQGHLVYVLDNLFTGRRRNIQHWIGHPNFQFFQADVVEPFLLEVDEIYHLACPASPPHYQYNPIKTIKTSTVGTLNMLGLAKRVKARMLFTSTSEVYGDPLEHPQKETYWGNVNTMGPRSCYDEGKRVAETMCYSYAQEGSVEVRIARIFNTFGPRMHPDDGRVVSNFIIQALTKKPLTVYGDGSQTRSFQYVTDLVSGLVALMASNYSSPVNLGNPDETSIGHFAKRITDMVNPGNTIVYQAAKKDDPHQRKPDISLAKRVLNWEPAVSVETGLRRTIDYFREEVEGSKDGLPSTWMQ